MTTFYIPITVSNSGTDRAIFAWLTEHNLDSQTNWVGVKTEYLTFARTEDALAFTLMFGHVCTLVERII